MQQTRQKFVARRQQSGPLARPVPSLSVKLDYGVPPTKLRRHQEIPPADTPFSPSSRIHWSLFDDFSLIERFSEAIHVIGEGEELLSPCDSPLNSSLVR